MLVWRQHVLRLRHIKNVVRQRSSWVLQLPRVQRSLWDGLRRGQGAIYTAGATGTLACRRQLRGMAIL